MDKLKIKEVITYTYTTSDGQEFDNKQEASVWQNHLDTIEQMRILDFEYKPIKNSSEAVYVHAKTQEQVDAFNALQEDFGIQARISGVGYHRYDDISDSFINIESEIKELQHHIDVLDGKENS